MHDYSSDRLYSYQKKRKIVALAPPFYNSVTPSLGTTGVTGVKCAVKALIHLETNFRRKLSMKDNERKHFPH